MWTTSVWIRIFLYVIALRYGERASDFIVFFLEPSVGPDSVSTSQVNKTTFNISWETLPRAKSYGKVIFYEVKANLLWKAHFYNWFAHNNLTVNTSSTFIVLFGLLICSEYNVSVRAYTGAGPGPYGEPLELVTSEFSTDQHIMSTTWLSCRRFWLVIIFLKLSF
mgnify:CR=1 FL=1